MGDRIKYEIITEDLELNQKFDLIEEMVDDEELLSEAEAWQTKKGKNKNGGLNKKGVLSLEKE